MEIADVVRVILWPGMLYLIWRMGYRAYRGIYDSPSMMLARAAIITLFISRSLLMAEDWHQPLNWLSTPSTILAMFLVWRASEL